MASLDPTIVTSEQLSAMLQTWAEGSFSDEGAVNLLAVHGTWLAREDFLKQCVEAVDDGWTREGSAPMAVINWDAAARFAGTVPASTSEVAILQLACSMAGVDTGAIGELTAGLDQTNTARVLDALAHRAGWHEDGIEHTTDAHQHPQATRVLRGTQP
jgi:hypothetical protein